MKNRERGAVFRQSLFDFPCPVALGRDTPSFGLHRFRQGLRFVPPDDEGFTLRGDKQRLLYKGRRRSHRFTILGDTAFEYDCILLKEPETNIITLRMEGAGNFDFFRQPDFVRDPFLKGSYAVYKKETLIGEGTGKLCHIHRPEIIDALGRRCWGELSIVGDKLHITIPQWFLSGAKYPVVVDPTIGTTTVGSLEYYNCGDYYDEEDDEWWTDYMPLWSMDTIVLNKTVISENVSSIGSFYVYKRGDLYKSRIKRTYPCMYNNVNNLPNTKISYNEQEIIDPYTYEQQGWLQAGVSKNCSINAGDNIWFGVRGYNLLLAFDFGGILSNIEVWKLEYYQHILLPEVVGDSYYSPFITNEYNREIKASMYLTYEKLANNYVQKIVQGVRLSDNRKLNISFNRKTLQTIKTTTAITKFQAFLRQCANTAQITSETRRKLETFRALKDNVSGNSVITLLAAYIRQCVISAVTNTGIRRLSAFYRSFFEDVETSDEFQRGLKMPRSCEDNIGSNDELQRSQGFNRIQSETVQAVGSIFRHLFIFIRLLTTSLVREFIIGRFLFAREELVLKSRIVREMVLESKLN